MRGGCHSEQDVAFSKVHDSECGVPDEVYGTFLDFCFELAHGLDHFEQIVVQLKRRGASVGEGVRFIWHG